MAPQSPDLYPPEHLWEVVEQTDVQLILLQQLCDAITSVQTKISKECFHHLMKSVHKELRQLLRQVLESCT